MIYRFTKKVHKITLFIGLVCLMLASSTSDFYILEMGTTEPEIVGRLITAGLIMVIPSVIYAVLKMLKEKKTNGIH